MMAAAASRHAHVTQHQTDRLAWRPAFRQACRRDWHQACRPACPRFGRRRAHHCAGHRTEVGASLRHDGCVAGTAQRDCQLIGAGKFFQMSQRELLEELWCGTVK